MLNAQQQLFPAELNFAQTRAAVFVAYINLYQAMGGGWVTQAETPTGNASPSTAPLKKAQEAVLFHRVLDQFTP